MPGNVAPIYAKVAKIGFAHLAAAVTAADLTNAGLIFTADATNGSIVNEVRIKYRAGTSTVATVSRLWINNNSTISTATNNMLIYELSLPAITTTNTAATGDFAIPMSRGGIALPPSYKLYAAIATWSTGAIIATAFGGDY